MKNSQPQPEITSTVHNNGEAHVTDAGYGPEPTIMNYKRSTTHLSGPLGSLDVFGISLAVSEVLLGLSLTHFEKFVIFTRARTTDRHPRPSYNSE